MPGFGEDLVQRVPEAEGAVADGQDGSAQSAPLALPHQARPGLRGPAVAVGHRDQLRGAQELLERGHEIPAGQPGEVEERQHLADLRGLAAPRRQDRRGEPLALAGCLVDALVVDARGLHLDRRDAAYSHQQAFLDRLASGESVHQARGDLAVPVSPGSPGRPKRLSTWLSRKHRQHSMDTHRSFTPMSSIQLPRMCDRVGVFFHDRIDGDRWRTVNSPLTQNFSI